MSWNFRKKRFVFEIIIVKVTLINWFTMSREEVIPSLIKSKKRENRRQKKAEDSRRTVVEQIIPWPPAILQPKELAPEPKSNFLPKVKPGPRLLHSISGPENFRKVRPKKKS